MAITYGGYPQQMGANPLLHGYGQPLSPSFVGTNSFASGPSKFGVPRPAPKGPTGRVPTRPGRVIQHTVPRTPFPRPSAPRAPLHGLNPGAANQLPGGSGKSVPGTPAPPGPVVYPSPLDAQYFQALNTATFNANNNIDATNLRSAYARIDLQNQLDQLAHQQPLDTLREQEAENARGGFAQGHLGQQIGELNRSYLDRQSTAQTNFGRQQAARDAAVAAIKGGLSLQQAALAAAAADRASVAAQRNPAVGGPGGPSLTGGSTPGATTPPDKTPGAAKPPKAPSLLSKNPAQNAFRPLQTRVVDAAKHASSAFTIPTPKPPRAPAKKGTHAKVPKPPKQGKKSAPKVRY